MSIDAISTALDEVLFVKAESPFGTLAYPAGADVVPLIGEAVFEQVQAFIDDPQKKITIDELAKLGLGFSPGTFSFTMMIKPSGTLGTACKGNTILKAGWGNETFPGPNTSVLYSLAGINDDVLGLSFIHRFGHMVTWNSGCVVDKLVFPVKAGQGLDSEGQVQVSGTFCKQVFAGYAYAFHATQFPIGATDIVVKSAGGVLDARQFEVSSKVRFRNATTGAVIDDNSGAGFAISAVVLATGTITIPALAVAVPTGSIVDGFVPTVSDAGTPVYGRLGVAQESLSGGTLANVIIIDAAVEVTNNFKIKDDEKTGNLYPATAIKSRRHLGYTCNKTSFKGDVSYFAESKAKTQKHISLPVGDVAAFRYRFDLPLVEFDTPKLSGSTDEISIGRTGTALASASYNDSGTMTFD